MTTNLSITKRLYTKSACAHNDVSRWLLTCGSSDGLRLGFDNRIGVHHATRTRFSDWDLAPLEHAISAACSTMDSRQSSRCRVWDLFNRTIQYAGQLRMGTHENNSPAQNASLNSISGLTQCVELVVSHIPFRKITFFGLRVGI